MICESNVAVLVGHGRVPGKEVGHVLIARVVRRRLGLRGLHGKGREEQDPATLHNAATYSCYSRSYSNFVLTKVGVPTRSLSVRVIPIGISVSLRHRET